MKFISTRGQTPPLGFSEAVAVGLAPDGGLFLPETLPDLSGELGRFAGLDYAALGLGDYGKPGDYLARQIARWSKQYTEDTAAGRVEAMDRLIEWLPEHLTRNG